MSFEEIYKAYWQKIYRLCMGYVNNVEWAEDMAQETFIIAWEQLPKFKQESSVGTWIFRIATNHCLRQLEREKRIPATEIQCDLPEVKSVDMEKETQFLYKCIAELPEMDRIIISLELEEINQSEIAAIVGISEVNVRVKIYRIKEKLTEKFRSYEQ